MCPVAEPQARITVTSDDQVIFRFVPAGDRLISADRSGAVHVWLVVDGREESTFFGHVGRVTGLGVSPDGRTIVSGDATGETRFWDVRTGQELINLRRHTIPVTLIEFAHSRGQRLGEPESLTPRKAFLDPSSVRDLVGRCLGQQVGPIRARTRGKRVETIMRMATFVTNCGHVFSHF
jgi:WD40 repeat protein